jgi:hypothetical protein
MNTDMDHSGTGRTRDINADLEIVSIHGAEPPFFMELKASVRRPVARPGRRRVESVVHES